MNETRRVRIGMLFTAATVMMVLLAITEPFAGDWQVWTVIAVGGVTGVGLLMRAWFARVLAGALFAAGLVFGLRAFIVAITDSWAGFDVDWIVAVANAAAATVLLSWLCVRSIQVMIGTTWPTGLVTVRLIGGTLVVVASSHLWWVARYGVGSQGGFTIDISPEGARMVGFPGWPLWHAALLLTALGLLVAPRRLLRHAATALAVMFVALLPLVSVAAFRFGMFDLLVVFVVVSWTLVPAALAWWLRDELREVAS